MRYGSKVGEVNWTRYAREKEAEISQFFQEKADEAVGKLREAGEARIAKAREKAVAAATKARGRGENNFTDAEIQSLADTVANEEREKEERKQDKRRSEIMGVKFRIQTLLNRLRAGSIYVVPQDLKQGTPEMFSQTFGTFVGFKFNKSYTLGSSTAIFATLDGRRKVELALSDPAISTIISATEMAYRYSPKEINAITMENWDSNVPTQTRHKRYIITGNLLQALVDTEKGEKTRGNLISYSTIDGETRQGILMGENFKLTDLRNSASLSSRLAQIREGNAVVSENGDVQISKEIYDWRHRGEYELRVPKSKQRGGIYTMHPGLLKLVEGHNFITKGNNMVAYVTEENIANVVDMLSREPFNLTVLQESQLTDTEIMERPGDGYGAYTDEEVSYLNDPVSKVMGKNRFSKKRQAEFAARERQRMVARIQELAERMHLDNVEILTDASQLEGKRAKAKGFYNKRTGKITIVIPNNVSTIDAEQTLLHEAVAHYGLRQLFGKQFDTFLDNVYQSADESIRKKIAEMAAQNGWNFRTATEEYLAGLAEDTNFEDARGYASGWWQRVKRLFIDMLERIGFEGFRDKVGVVLTDNELRYILWRSYENLAEPGRYRSILGEAKDVAMQSDLKVGNYAERGIEAEYAAEPSAITELSKRFDEALKQYEERRLPQGFRFELGMPSAYLKSAGFPNLPICMRATLLARKAGDERHPFEASDLKGLVEAIQQPIAIFEYSKPNMRNLIVDVKRGDKHFLVGVTLDYKTGDIEINSVSGLFPKESHEWIKWIQDGKAIRIDQKEKVQTIIDSLRTNPAESERIGLNLDDVTKIVKSFENPTVEEEELFRPGDFSPRDKALARHEYERIVSSGSYQFQEAVQDSMLGLKKLYQAILGPGKRIEDVVGFENAYLFENRMSSMNAGEQHEYFIRYMQPLLKEIGKICGADKRKRKELTDYLMAKHGLERNEYMRNEAAKNGEKTDRDFAGLIGLTGEADWQNAEDTARQWVDDYESMVDTAALWEAINKATKATLEKVYLSGIISKETYEKILGMYDYYVPLRGWNETTSEQVYGYLTSKDGPLGGSIMKKAEGRESMADDPIATIGMMADDVIRQGNRNLMKQRFLNFILNHPSDAVSVHDIWLEYNDAMDEWVPVFADIEDTDTADEVAQKVEAFEQRMEALRAAEPTKYKRGREAQHIPYKVVKGNLREHQVLIKRNGRTFVATINGNPRAAQALNGLTNPDVDQNGVVGNMLKAGTWINRQLSAFYTTRNPDFVVSNFFRDALYSNCMTWVKESPRYALRFHKNFGRLNPVVMRRLLGKWENGTLDMSDKYEKMFYQFMKNGGETGYTNVRDIEGHKRAVAAELKKQGSTGRKAWAALGMQLDLLNRSAENCARFAAFVTSREFGRSIDRAIYDAKEISVNFNKKGSGGKMVNANGQTALGKIGAYLGGGGRLLYVFWNAGIQGMTNFARQAKLHPVKATAGASALMALGYAIPMLAEMLGGGDGDDDDKNAYYNLPEYIRRSNICFYAGEQWVTIPLPIEYRAMYGMGELAYGVISGNERYSGMELGLQMAGQVTQLLPIDMLEGGGGISPFIPSAAKPFTEAYIMNKSWTGLPVYKDTAFNKDDPEWTKAYASADKHLVDFAKWLNEISGGDDYKKGYIDINPAKIEYLLNGTFGGMFTFPNKLNKTGETIFGDREFEWRNIPIANRLIKSGDERTANRKLQNEYFKYLKEYESTRKLMKKYENAADEGVIKYAEKVNFLENSPEYLRHEIFDSFKPDIDADREAIADAERSERATAENQMYADMRQLVNALHDPTAYFKNLYDAGLLDDEYIEWLKSHHGIKLK
nr:MAG TPA: Large polyvalent protein associated domain 38 [Caudoviricetes sp.]